MESNSTGSTWVNSKYYRLVYSNLDEKREQFVQSLLQKLQPASGSKILHCGCGDGRYTKLLANTDLDITGADFNEEAIKEAIKLEQDNLHFVEHDMRLLFWINYFDYALSLFNTFGFYRTTREHNNYIRSIAQSLHAGGTLVIDYMNLSYEESHINEKEEFSIDGRLVTIAKNLTDEHIFKDITVQEDVDSKTFVEKTTKLSLGNFTEMLSSNGMQVEEVFGDYNFADYNTNYSLRLIIKACKMKM